MVNDLNDTHHHKPLKISTSSSMTHVIDNTLNDFSNSDDQTIYITPPTGITSPLTFNANKFNKITQFKLLPKRKHNLHSKTNKKLHQQYIIQLYVVIRLSIPLLMTTLLITFLPIMIITALSKYNPKQTILFPRYLLRLHSFYLFPSVLYT